MMSSSRALWFVEPRRVELRDEPDRAPGEGEVVARALASGVSQGSELLLYRGEGPARFDDSVSSGGAASTYPRRYGYAWVGELEAGGGAVFALAPHGERHVLRAEAARAIPATIPPTRAVLAANLETAITCTWDAHPSLGDRAVVMGGGVVGILTAWLLARAGARVVLVEASDARRRAALALAPGLVVEAPAAHSGPGGAPDADLVVEATGDPRTLDAAIARARPEARVVVASFYGSRRAPIDLGDAFHRRRLELRSSQVSSIPPRLSARWSYDRRWALVLELLAEPALDALLAPPTPFAQAPALYAALDVATDAPPAHVFVYR